MRAQIVESREATMARFLHGLNREIQDIVEVQYYTTLEELVHKATKVELQLKKRHMSRKPYPSDSKRGKERESPRKDKIPKDQKEGRVLPPPSSSKCFTCLGKGHIDSQCLNKRTMVMRKNRKVESESCQRESTSSSMIESSSDHSHYEGELLMVRRLMKEARRQRENNFHSRCLVLEKQCSTIINGRNSLNVDSSRLTQSEEIVVDGQVLLTFTLANYVDEVMCDVVPMEATHILLGRP
ncbi:hypothetical protein CR513_26293, partial [Mucuna pruriens]